MNPLEKRTSPESICLRAFLLVLSERDTAIYCYTDPKDVFASEEAKAVASASKAARASGVIHPRYIDLMAKVIQGMGYSGEEGHWLLTFFRNRMPIITAD